MSLAATCLENCKVSFADYQENVTLYIRSFPVISNSKLTHDTHQIKVALPPSTTLGMTVASCLTIRANIDGNVVARPYTPVSTKDQKDYAEFIIKAYPPRTDDKPGGMGRHLINLKEGDAIEMKGPWSKHQYVPNSFNKVIMIAGGTGITPCLQVITEILSNSNDKTDVVLIYANKTEGDIIVREMLDDLSRKHQNFSLLYTLEKPPEKWAGEVGYVDESMIRKANSLGNQAQGGDITFVCGPPPMMESVCGAKGPKGSQGEVGGILKKM